MSDARQKPLGRRPSDERKTSVIARLLVGVPARHTNELGRGPTRGPVARFYSEERRGIFLGCAIEAGRKVRRLSTRLWADLVRAGPETRINAARPARRLR